MPPPLPACPPPPRHRNVLLGQVAKIADVGFSKLAPGTHVSNAALDGRIGTVRLRQQPAGMVPSWALLPALTGLST